MATTLLMKELVRMNFEWSSKEFYDRVGDGTLKERRTVRKWTGRKRATFFGQIQLQGKLGKRAKKITILR